MNDQNAEVVNSSTAREATPGTTTTEGFGTVTSLALAETSSAAVAAQAQATVQARYVMAMQRPRDWDTVRSRIMLECRRPRFAKVARYLKPIGRGVEGPSIRFAEVALRCMGNVLVEQSTIFDDNRKRIIRVSVTDLESNLTYPADVTVEKTVERSSVKPGQEILSARTNSQGKKAYLVAAIEDDLLNKQGALVSKALRTLALRILPGDILDEAMDTVIKTQGDEDAKDPGAARKAIVDAFAGVGVKPSDLKAYVGHDLDALVPKELAELRAVYAAMRDGEATWADALSHKQGAKPAERAATVQEKVAAKAREAKAAKEKSAVEAPPATRPHDPSPGEVAPEDEPPADDRGDNPDAY